ncbi:PEP-CTERM sorting domain-containing protein [Aquincola sp. S2]|uniref:PEP-CTERM sorting domain-containing protein n=1 Tax=Pseudaquabacterium terrae TaxID=2732868 RepID=A0ABX2EQ14_9BURK|nr:PEP-CTERM sorting domain-containing protein [Aquabacterium terrae]NRF70713.1 PEP-CTERM sorting domain-containing protein [Aquabacterium terrae]
MKPLKNSACRALAGAGLLLTCGMLGQGILPDERAASSDLLPFDPGAFMTAVADPGDGSVTIAGVLLPAPAGSTVEWLAALGLDFGVATVADPDAPRSGDFATPTNGDSRAIAAVAGLLAGAPVSGGGIALPSLPSLPGVAGGHDPRDRDGVQPIIAALIEPNGRMEPSSVGEPPGSNTPDILAAIPGVLPADAFDPAPSDLRRVAAIKPSDSFGPRKRENLGALPAGRPVAAANRPSGSPFGPGGPWGPGGHGPDDPFERLFEGPGRIADPIGDGGQPPSEWGNPVAPIGGPDGTGPNDVVAAVVPEPASLLLLALALLGLGGVTRRRAEQAPPRRR